MADYKWFSKVHRFVYEKSGGLIGTKMAGQTMGLLTTTGRKSGEQRTTPLAYYALDPAGVIVLGSNNGNPKPPLWWLNLQAHPDATVRTRDGERPVRARRALGDERERLWSRWAGIDRDLDAYAARRPTETAVVVLEPRDTGTTSHGAGRSPG